MECDAVLVSYRFESRKLNFDVAFVVCALLQALWLQKRMMDYLVLKRLVVVSISASFYDRRDERGLLVFFYITIPANAPCILGKRKHHSTTKACWKTLTAQPVTYGARVPSPPQYHVIPHLRTGIRSRT